jgi:hypothetical protein
MISAVRISAPGGRRWVLFGAARVSLLREHGVEFVPQLHDEQIAAVE